MTLCTHLQHGLIHLWAVNDVFRVYDGNFRRFHRGRWSDRLWHFLGSYNRCRGEVHLLWRKSARKGPLLLLLVLSSLVNHHSGWAVHTRSICCHCHVHGRASCGGLKGRIYLTRKSGWRDKLRWRHTRNSWVLYSYLPGFCPLHVYCFSRMFEGHGWPKSNLIWILLLISRIE